MARKVKTEKELGEALKAGEDEIEIVGDLARKTIRIRATGKVAWAIAFGAIGVAAFATYATIGTGGTGTPITGPTAAFSATAAVAVLGVPSTVAAISIAIAAGGVGALTSLRKYSEISRSNSTLVLRRR
ncbi:MAG: hypothetical protein Q8N13_09450 [Acidovorax sp.]|nr:hypothetical protein [Acidovorax sp.]